MKFRRNKCSKLVKGGKKHVAGKVNERKEWKVWSKVGEFGGDMEAGVERKVTDERGMGNEGQQNGR